MWSGRGCAHIEPNAATDGQIRKPGSCQKGIAWNWSLTKERVCHDADSPIVQFYAVISISVVASVD